MTFLSRGHVRVATTALMGVGILAGSLSLVGARMLFDVLR
jgi:hypothetical protein